MQIITGSTNFDNVTSNADASKHLGFIGADAVALNIGRKLEAAVGQTNNEVRIYDGEGFAQGIHFRVEPGTYDSVAIENGEAGVKRTDLIVCRYQIDDNGYESTEWKTIKGAAGGAVPSYQQGSVRDESGDVIDVPFYRVELDGLSITRVTPLFSVLMTWAEMQTMMSMSNDVSVTFNDNKAPNQKTITLLVAKKGGVVTARTAGVFNFMTANKKVTLSGVLPEGYKPKGTVGIACQLVANAKISGSARFEVGTNGSLTYVSNATGWHEVYFDASWTA